MTLAPQAPPKAESAYLGLLAFRSEDVSARLQMRRWLCLEGRRWPIVDLPQVLTGSAFIEAEAVAAFDDVFHADHSDISAPGTGSRRHRGRNYILLKWPLLVLRGFSLQELGKRFARIAGDDHAFFLRAALGGLALRCGERLQTLPRRRSIRAVLLGPWPSLTAPSLPSIRRRWPPSPSPIPALSKIPTSLNFDGTRAK
jgi:hypothetical protein